MKYMLLMLGSEADWDAMAGGTDDQGRAWSPEDVKALVEHMQRLNDELESRGELVDAQGLAAPSRTRTVRVVDGVRQVSDGPYGESKEVLAGYWVVDVESEERALEIAARASAAPGPGGSVDEGIVEVRPIMETAGGQEM
ncbi:YciI family protein [Streptomyces sp. YIM 98790]|uniref:YciI family protein n=1 Tax=Streptomyces sp. YIM 98790 TaxID=2689077 RepID=UPI00140CA435|nr:YciI family protein [Streptomyces sp. YIM 98790]